MYKRETSKQRKEAQKIAYLCCIVCRKVGVQLFKRKNRNPNDNKQYVCVSHK